MKKDLANEKKYNKKDGDDISYIYSNDTLNDFPLVSKKRDK